MGENWTELDSFTLSAAQASVIGALAAGRKVSDAAEQAGVDRTTVYVWMKNDADFVAELNRARWEYREQLRAGLETLATEAVGTLSNVLKAHSAELRARTAVAALRITRNLATQPCGPTDPDEIRAEWARAGAKTGDSES
jgi:hypothetical protein